MKQIFFLCVAVLIFSCQGEDGEPGPKGEQGEQGVPGTPGADGQDAVTFEKDGFFEGSVSGNRKDGTAFSETFKYEYSFETGTEGFLFNDNFSKYVFEIERREILSKGNLYMSLEVLNKGTGTETFAFLKPGQNYTYYPLYFLFTKELSATTLFRVEASAQSTSTEFTHIVNPTANATYKFALREDGFYNVDYIYDQALQEGQQVLKTTDGKWVYFEDQNTNFDGTLGYNYGNLIKVLNANGSVAANAPYNQLRLSSINGKLILRDLAGTDLSSTVTIPGDVLQVTNYNKDATTGIITFDFTVTIGVLARSNSSGNPLTIAGKFNSGSKVYSDIVSRKGG